VTLALTVVHVAEASENRGRVVLRLGSSAPHRIAVEAALRIARAYHSELESVFVEDQQLIDITGYADTREVSLCGREVRALSTVAMLRQFAYAAREAERQIAAMARLADIPYRGRTIRDDPVHAINRACAEAGPWNVVTLADPVGARDRVSILHLLDELSGATGVVLIGPAATRAHGPVVIVLEDIARLTQMLRAAERLTVDTGDPLQLVLLADQDASVRAMEAHVRLALGDRTDISLAVVPPAYGHPGAVMDVLRRLRAGFVVGQVRGALLPADGDWSDLAQSLECPIFIVR
jgi:hypothetical protein